MTMRWTEASLGEFQPVAAASPTTDARYRRRLFFLGLIVHLSLSWRDCLRLACRSPLSVHGDDIGGLRSHILQPCRVSLLTVAVMTESLRAPLLCNALNGHRQAAALATQHVCCGCPPLNRFMIRCVVQAAMRSAVRVEATICDRRVGEHCARRSPCQPLWT